MSAGLQITELGGYRLREKLGSGGSGTVYRAIDADGREVAFKLLHASHAADPAERRRLQREVAALQKIRDPHISAVLDAEIDSSEAFIVTELVDGASLGDSVRGSGPLSQGDLALLATSLARALGVVHAAGLVHRDLKPANVMLGRRGPVLIDFGIADDGGGQHLTRTGMIVGTPGYLAPELLAGGKPTAQTDWWSWAAVLCFAGTGRHPFGAGKIEAILARVRAGRPDIDGLPAPSARVLAEALSPDLSSRPAPSEVIDEIMADAGEIAWNDSEPTSVVAPGWIATPTRVLEVAPPDPAEAQAWNTAAGKPGGAPTAAAAAQPAARETETDEFGDVAALLASRPSPPATLTPWPPGARPAPVPPAPGTGATALPGTKPGGMRPGRARDAAAGQATGHAPREFAGGPAPLMPPGPAARPADPAPSPAPAPAGASAPGEVPVKHVARTARRTGTLLVLLLLTGAAATLAPWITLICLTCLFVLFRAVGRAQAALAAKRARKGQRRGDAAGSVLALPWHLAIAAIAQVPAAVIGLVAGILLGWLLARQLPDALGGSPLWLPAGLALGAIAYALIAWAGPLKDELQRGALAVLFVTIPRGRASRIAALLALTAAAAVTAWWLTGAPAVTYWPAAAFSASFLAP